MIIVLPGIPPSKKNNKQIVRNRRTGRSMIISSDAHNTWHTLMVLELRKAKIPMQQGFSLVEIVFFPPDRRRHDSTNVEESIFDLFVDCGIIEDDNWFIVSDKRARLGGIDPENPRVEITFHY